MVIFYGPKETPEASRKDQKPHKEATSLGGAPSTLGRAEQACRSLVGPLDVKPMPNIPINRETPQKKPRSEVPPPQASRATKNQSGARSGTLPEGETITRGHLHHPGGLHDEEGVVHPRGRGYVPVAMCLISLSLSLSCS